MSAAAASASMQFTPEWYKQPRKQPSKQTSFSSLGEEVKPPSLTVNAGGPTYSSLVGGTIDSASGGSHPSSGVRHDSTPNSASVWGAPAGGGPTNIHTPALNPNINSHNVASSATPFRYSKEQLLNVWKDGGGRAPLGLEVERWPGIVRDTITEPVGLREMSTEERKLFASQSLNSTPATRESNPRRRTGNGAGADGSSPATTPSTTAPKGGPFSGGLGTSRSERGRGAGTESLGGIVSPGGSGSLLKRRKDDTGDTPAPIGVYRPRQLSVTIGNGVGLGGPLSPTNTLPSPRSRIGSGGNVGVDGVLEGSWMGLRRRPSDRTGLSVATTASGIGANDGAATSAVTDTPLETYRERFEGNILHGDLAPPVEVDTTPRESQEVHLVHRDSSPATSSEQVDGSNGDPSTSESLPTSLVGFSEQLNAVSNIRDDRPKEIDLNLPPIGGGSTTSQTLLDSFSSSASFDQPNLPSVSAVSNEAVQWRYKDESGQIQGPFPSSSMDTWYQGRYFPDRLLIQRYDPPYDALNPEAFEPLMMYKRKLHPTLEGELFRRGTELAPPRPPNLPMPTAGVNTVLHDEPILTPIFPSASGSGLATALYPNTPSPASAFGSPFFNESRAIGRSVSSGRKGSFDSFSGTALPNHGMGVSPSPLNSSPALSNDLAQSYGTGSIGFSASGIGAGGNDGAVTSYPTDRERQDREQYFRLLRERELASSNLAPGQPRTPSIDTYGGTGTNGYGGPFGSAPGGSGIGRAIGRSPSSPATVSQLGGYSQNQQSPVSQYNYHSAFPRPTPLQQHTSGPGQQGSLPPSPFQQNSNNAWSNPPAGHLARQLAAASFLAPGPHPSAERPGGHPLNSYGWDSDPQSQESSRYQTSHQQSFNQGISWQPMISERGGDQTSLFGQSSFTNADPSLYHLGQRYSGAVSAQQGGAPKGRGFGSQSSFPAAELPSRQQMPYPAPSDSGLQSSLLADTSALAAPAPVMEEVAAQVQEMKIESRAPIPSINTQVAADLAGAPITSPVSRTSAIAAPSPPAAASALPKGHPQSPISQSEPLSFAMPSALQPKSKPANRPSAKERPSAAVETPTTAPAISTEAGVPSQNTVATSLPGAGGLTAPTAPAKPAWSTAATASSATSATAAGISLREIQEAEAKRAEARKEKEKALRVASVPNAPASTSGSVSGSEDVQLPKVTTWGLLQAGQARSVKISTPASAGTAPTGTTPPAVSSVWSTPATKAPGPKKSMKEILEEEERRKKAQAQATSSAASVLSANGEPAPTGRKAYVETAKAGESRAPSSTSTAWTTVGNNGKAVPVPTPIVLPASLPARPQTSLAPSPVVKTPVSAIPAPMKGSAAIVVSSNTGSASIGSNTAKKASTQYQDDIRIPPPSSDFIKWTKEALRGLTGVNMDEFITMLLDFPIEPDASTMEIISDSVYANSSVLDGRRFASEFVAKRKTDIVKTRGGGWGKSVADVVKTQQKLPEKEWGYKIVTKKGKKT